MNSIVGFNWQTYRLSNRVIFPEGKMTTFQFGFIVNWGNVCPAEQTPSQGSGSAHFHQAPSNQLATRTTPFNAVGFVRGLPSVAKTSLVAGATMGLGYALTTAYLTSQASAPGKKAAPYG